MIIKPTIMASISSHNALSQGYELIDILISKGITNFRFNLCKLEDSIILEDFLNYIIQLKCRYSHDVRINIDLPYPGNKFRLYFYEGHKSIHKGDVLHVSSQKEQILQNNIIKVNSDLIYNKLFVGQEIIYSDGIGHLYVDKIIDGSNIYLRALNDFEMYSGGSLSLYYINESNVFDDTVYDKIIELSPDSISFSFVNDVQSLNKLKSTFRGIEVEFISKIETIEGTQNIDDISKESNIMLARGDLFLNVDYTNLFSIQRDVSYITKKNAKKLYIATGIMPSLAYNAMPTQAEIIDISNILLLDPDVLILSYEVVSNNIDKAIKIIERVCDNLNKRSETNE